VYHESIKQNTPIGSSPAYTMKTRSNHVFAAIYAYVKLEVIKLNHGFNHFSVKSQIYLASLKAAMELLSAFNVGDNVPAAYDVLAARIRKCVAFPGPTKCGGATAWEWSEAE
jgi:heterodisulfide reductase subunit B